MKTLFRFDKIVLIVTVFIGGVAVLYSFLSPPIYRASLQLSIDPGSMPSPLTKNLDSWQAYVEEECAALKNKSLLDKVVEKLHLKFSKKFANVGDPAYILKKAVRIKHAKGTNLVNIDISMDSPELASRVAKSLVEAYFADKDEKKFLLTKDAVSWFKEANEISTKIRESEEALNKFINENGLGSLEAELKDNKNRLADLINQKDRNETTIKELGDKLSEIENILKAENKEKVFLVLKDSSILFDLKNAKEQMELQINKLKTKYEEKHPEIIKLRGEVENIDKTRDEIVNDVVKNYKNEIFVAQNKIGLITEEIKRVQKKLGQLKTSEERASDLTRKLDINQKFYNEVLARLQDKQFSLVEITSLGFLDQQTPAAILIGPKKTRNIIVGIIMGLILGNITSVVVKKRISPVGKITNSISSIIAAFLLFMPAVDGHSALEYQKTGSAKKNSSSGYNFYDSSNKKTGSSIANRSGGYDYYNDRGKKVGSLKEVTKFGNDYEFFDEYGIKRGILKKAPSGIYYYKDIESGKMVDSLPQTKGQLGSLSPDIFRGKKTLK